MPLHLLSVLKFLYLGWHCPPATDHRIICSVSVLGLVLLSAYIGQMLRRNRDRQQPGGSYGRFKQYAGLSERQAAIHTIRSALGPDSVTTDNLERWSHSDESTVNSMRSPDAVVFPETTKDVVQIMKIASRFVVPVIPICAKSSLEGNAASPYGGIAISFGKMNQVVAVHEHDRQAVIQPGVAWMDLNENRQVKSAGLFFPIDPAPQAQFGGMVALNCSGTNAVKYGTMRHNVVNLTFVTADGKIIRTRGRPAKSSAGYDLTQLIIGSEGTLGIVTEITVKLRPRPRHTGVVVASFPSCRKAIEASLALQHRNIDVQCIELMDGMQMKAFNQSLQSSSQKWPEKDTLLVKLSGTSSKVCDEVELTTLTLRAKCSLFVDRAANDQEAQDLWKARKHSFYAMQRLAGNRRRPWSTDVAVPLSELANIIDWSKQELKRLGLMASILGHVGDGNFHCSIFYEPQTELFKVENFNNELIEKALEAQGTCTGEHGIGIGKKLALRKELGEDNLDQQRRIKAAWDPLWILNPGKVFEADRYNYAE